ncbi:hypothetical protein TRAPUB_3108 [Trametes pubescens]|uniref:Uncharacterized protein n=1 Tax=Trametes pubescens TaxID=154538 RepID=A0A1M2VEP1_TRAPU|nr:hypothetical protein TRAPUB_3108 [Trametes pubescens]
MARFINLQDMMKPPQTKTTKRHYFRITPLPSSESTDAGAGLIAETSDFEDASDAASTTDSKMAPEDAEDMAAVCRDLSDDFCQLCHDGGDLVVCSSCPRAFCIHHVPEYRELDECEQAVARFRCLCCHQTSKEAVAAAKAGQHLAYRAFFRPAAQGSLKPTSISPTKLAEIYGHKSVHARCNTGEAVVIQLRLSGMPSEGSTAKIFHETLCGYFLGGRKSQLKYIDAAFNVRNDKAAKEWASKLDKKLEAVERMRNARVMIFVLTHSNDDTGNLMLSPNPVRFAGSMKEWFDGVFTPKLRSIVMERDTTVAFLSCGALVRTQDTLQGLVDHAKGMRLARVFGFHAESLQPAFTAQLFQTFAHKVWIEGNHFDDTHIGELLSNSVHLGRHTHVILITLLPPEGPSVAPRARVAEYFWTLKTYKPWGWPMPIQCPVCFSIMCLRSEDYKPSRDADAERVVHVGCKAEEDPTMAGDGSKKVADGALVVRCLRKGCKYKKLVQKREGSRLIKSGEGGSWMTVDLDAN